MSDVKDLLPNIKWENHKIPNGMLSISVIPEAYKEKMETAHKGMEATIERLKSRRSDGTLWVLHLLRSVDGGRRRIDRTENRRRRHLDDYLERSGRGREDS